MCELAGWMCRVSEICTKAGTEAELDKYAEDLAAIRTEVRETALKYPLPT